MENLDWETALKFIFVFRAFNMLGSVRGSSELWVFCYQTFAGNEKPDGLMISSQSMVLLLLLLHIMIGNPSNGLHAMCTIFFRGREQVMHLKVSLNFDSMSVAHFSRNCVKSRCKILIGNGILVASIFTDCGSGPAVTDCAPQAF
jgi:hypothetical protein